jgi:uncharacterized protein YwqG
LCNAANPAYFTPMKFFDLFRKKKEPDQGASHGVNHRADPSATIAYRLQVKASALPSVHIKAAPANHLFLFDSKFGGHPYWPLSRPYPTDSEGKTMHLLAQLNFSQIPKLEGYPDQGLLQFYVAANDWYGANFDHPADQTNFRVIYFEDVQQAPIEDFRFLTETKRESALPVEAEMQLQFSLQTDYVNYEDVRYENYVDDEAPVTPVSAAEQGIVSEAAFLDDIDNRGHKIGGYASFTQDDPRRMGTQYKDWILLLQIDSQFDSILWGDVGIGNFFIHPEALARKDFSNVLYYWDCT